jgi:hypothetical protein
MGSKLLTTTVSLFLILTASLAWAACAQSDLQGTWQAYAVDLDGSYWIRCTVKIGAGGGITTGKPCKDSEGGQFQTTSGGHLSLTSACIVKGTVSIGGAAAEVIHATLDKGRSVVTGVGDDEIGGAFIFNAIKP